MDTYNVGTNKPIKLKASIASPAASFTYVGLNDPDNPSKFIKDIRFETKPTSGWKQLNGGATLKDRVARIRTLLDFFGTTDDENEFNLLVQQSANSFVVALSGGTPDQIDLQFTTKSNFEHRSAIFSSEITFK